MQTTKDPVVFIHGTAGLHSTVCVMTCYVGFMGWGKITPLFNTMNSYWPLHDLIDINPNFYIVDVGKVSSDHDRACEAFYQLYGGQVDYGEEHSKECGTMTV